MNLIANAECGIISSSSAIVHLLVNGAFSKGSDITELIEPPERIRDHVWKGRLSDGQQAIWKIARSDRFSTEVTVLRYLGGMGCPVPTLLDSEKERGIIVTTWCGDETVDDICQQRDREKCQRLS
jgi:hypothetical protein